MWVSDPVVLVIECPVESLFTASSLWVMEVEGTVTNALLMSTSLTCQRVKGVTILNGLVCAKNTSTTSAMTNHYGMYRSLLILRRCVCVCLIRD